MDYTSHAMEEVRRFYTEVLGLSDSTYDASMQYLRVGTGPSSSLGFRPPMPGPPEQWRPPREPSIYLMVEDVDRVYRDLVQKGVRFEQAPADMPWGHRMAFARDPEGRAVCFAQVMSRD
jgi:predicted enzyme related to lactoylglutathione lyase